MRHFAWRRLQACLVAALAAAGLAFVSCTPEERHRVLVFFFDGVPPLHPGGESSELSAGGKAGAPATPGAVRAVAAAPELYEHKPGRDSTQCGVCHDARNSYQLRKPLAELCRSCHEREMSSFARMHGPVAFGDCAACHEAHRSRYKYLVKEPSPALCFRCHDRLPKQGKPPGCTRTTDDVNCVTCHDPHGGTNPVFLIGGAAQAGGRSRGQATPPPKEAP